MVTELSAQHKKSKLDQFKLTFEYNRSFRDERKMTRRRNDTLVNHSRTANR